MKKVVLNGCFGGYGLSKEAYDFLGIPWDGYGYDFIDDRENPKLIECVETLGEKASGYYAGLYVEEYDDYNYTYTIDEYDGSESLVLHPIIHKKDIETMNAEEIIEHLINLGIEVVD